jgi:hypothetical protein
MWLINDDFIMLGYRYIVILFVIGVLRWYTSHCGAGAGGNNTGDESMAIEQGSLKIDSLTEANVNERGVDKTWGANYLYGSGGLQNDIIMIAEQFDSIKSVGFTPSASGSLNLGTLANPLGTIYTNAVVAGSPDASGALFVYGTDDYVGGDRQLFEITVEGSAVTVQPVGAVAIPR